MINNGQPMLVDPRMHPAQAASQRSSRQGRSKANTQYNNMYEGAQTNTSSGLNQMKRAMSNYSSKIPLSPLVPNRGSTSALSTNQTDGLLGTVATCPSVPGKSQRVLINKRQGAKSTNSAARLFGKRPLQSAGKNLSSTMSSETGLTYSAFKSKQVSQQKPPFGSKDQRFAGKLELKELYNRDPGPGTYSENASTVESSLNSVMEKLKGLDGNIVEQTFGAKCKRFVPLPEMLTCDPRIQVGPGQYEPNAVERHVPGPKMEYKGDFSLPFNEKNPLNYVKPITVNIYFKQSIPGVGQYNPR